MSRSTPAAAVTLGAMLLSAPALAHIRLDVPDNRYDDPQKSPPCGAGDDERSEQVSVYEPGETISVQWEETIDHPSHFRISFSASGTDAFEDPSGFEDYYTNETVLLDEIADPEGKQTFEAEVALPDEPCESCTLQLIQVMYDKSIDNAFYYQCADIALREGGGSDADAGGGPGGDADAGGGAGGGDAGLGARPSGGGCGAGESADPGAAVLVSAALVVAGYRPRARSARGG